MAEDNVTSIKGTETPINDETVDLETFEPPMCTVVMDDSVKTSDDFVTVMCDREGNTSIWYNTDALTLGMAIKMLSGAYMQVMSETPAEERKAIIDFLGDAFAVDFPEEAAE